MRSRLHARCRGSKKRNVHGHLVHAVVAGGRTCGSRCKLLRSVDRLTKNGFSIYGFRKHLNDLLFYD